jgi:hypothetical protein
MSLWDTHEHENVFSEQTYLIAVGIRYMALASEFFFSFRNGIDSSHFIPEKSRFAAFR